VFEILTFLHNLYRRNRRNRRNHQNTTETTIFFNPITTITSSETILNIKGLNDTSLITP
jgi:hypothetical protein